MQDLVLPEHAVCSDISIAELEVRTRFGCSIVEINRGGHTISSPDPFLRICSGDRLLLMGTPAQLGAARQGLEQVSSVDARSDFDDVLLETVLVPLGPRIGKSLTEMEIPRQTGVLVTGIRRRNEKIINPTGGDQLLEGDELLVMGEPQQIHNFRIWLMFFCVESAQEYQQ